MFVLYAIEANSVDYTSRQVHDFTDFILRCGLNADVDLYHSSKNIINWPAWTLKQLKVCTDNNGCIILLWSKAMETILTHGGANDNSVVEMVYARVDRLSLLSLIQDKIKHFVLVCLDSNMSKDQITATLPPSLSEKTVHNISLKSVPYNMPVKELLEQEQFSDLKYLVATLSRWQKFKIPSHLLEKRSCKYYCS